MRHVRRRVSLVFAILQLASIASAQAPARSPAADRETLLDTFFHNESGVLRFDDYVLAFAPAGGVDGGIVVSRADGTRVAAFPFIPDYRAEDGVFARVSVRGPSEVTLPSAGAYTIGVVVRGDTVSSLSFEAERSTGGDPLNPKTSWRLRGPWSSLGHLTMRTARDGEVPVLSLWVGSNDLPAGARNGRFAAQLYRNGRLVATSKRSQGHIASGHYKRTTIDLWRPHDPRQEQNAVAFTRADWTQPGTYELRITRPSDEARLRTFRYEVADGAIVPLPETALAHTPAAAYIPPRVARKNANTFEIIEAIWLRAR